MMQNILSYKTAWQSENNHKNKIKWVCSNLTMWTFKKGIPSTPHVKRTEMAASITSWQLWMCETMKWYAWQQQMLCREENWSPWWWPGGDLILTLKYQDDESAVVDSQTRRQTEKCPIGVELWQRAWRKTRPWVHLLSKPQVLPDKPYLDRWRMEYTC